MRISWTSSCMVFSLSMLSLGIMIPSPGFAQSTPPYLYLPDVGFAATKAEELPLGIHFSVESGPTGGPYRSTEFFQGITSTEGGGAWAQRDNTWGICFNLDKCSGHRILPDLYDFSYTLESSYQSHPSAPTLIEQNFNMRYADGTFHRPWAMHIWNEQKAAVLNFSSKPGEVSFQVNQNGKTVIGSPFRQPIKQLEVVGDALVTGDLEVDGALLTDGLPVLLDSESTTSGPLRWAVSNGDDLNSAIEVCAEARLECGSAMLPRGQILECSASIAQGVVFFALCR